MPKISSCRACGGSLTQFLDLGKQYLSDFREDEERPPKYPLVAVICEDCKLVQLKHTTPQKEMYHERYGFKSSINEKIVIDLDDVVTHAFQYQNNPQRWLDIASNDGTLLSFVPNDIYRVGVDPVKFLCQEAEQFADLIIPKYFDSKYFKWQDYDLGGAVDGYTTFDVITCISCFYDMPDPSKFVQDVKNVLAKKGVWVIQQNYLLTTMQLKAVDNFCHEHLEYYNLNSLENLLDRFDLEVNEVHLSTVNGGSIRTIVSHKGTYEVDKSVFAQRMIEEDYGLDTLEPYEVFASEAMDNIDQLHRLVSDLKDEGKSVAILAASTRGATIWQCAEFGPDLIDYAVERNPAKVGKMFSAINIPIISEEEAHSRMPDYMIIGPWFFADQIIDRERPYIEHGGSLIIPLPKVEIIDGTR